MAILWPKALGAADFELLEALVAFYAFGVWKGFFWFLFTLFAVLFGKAPLKMKTWALHKLCVTYYPEFFTFVIVIEESLRWETYVLGKLHDL